MVGVSRVENVSVAMLLMATAVIAQDEAAPVHEGRDDACVRLEAAREQEAGRPGREVGERGLEALVDLESAGHETRGGRAGPERFARPRRPRDHVGIAREPEVVVGREVQKGATIPFDHRRP